MSARDVNTPTRRRPPSTKKSTVTHAKRKYTSAKASTAANFTRVYEYEAIFNKLRDEKASAEGAGEVSGEADAATRGLHYENLKELMGLWDIPVTDDGFQEVLDDIELAIEQRGDPAEFCFEACLQILLKPQYDLCLAASEPMRPERLANIDKHIATLLGDDMAARDAAARKPPTEIMGDRQACRMVALLLDDKTRPEEHRIFLARALGVIAEKPRLLSGEQPPEGEKRRKMYDIKAMAGYMKALKLLDTPTFLDKRTLWNPDPVPGMPDRASEVGYVAAALEWREAARAKGRGTQFVPTVPLDDPLADPAFFLEFRAPRAEPGEAVRAACVEGLLATADHEHEAFLRTMLRTAEWDPGLFVRAAAVDALGRVATNIGKLGLSTRWGDGRFWWAEAERPWRSREGAVAEFWRVLCKASADPAWQVRKAAILAIAAAVDVGNRGPPLAAIAARLEDELHVLPCPAQPPAACAGLRARAALTRAHGLRAAQIVRSNALMMLVEAVFGRGAFVSERAVRIVALTTGEGVTPRSAVKRADAEAEASKGADWDRAALHAILDRMRLEASMSRRTAVQALGEVVTRARVRGDEECIAGLLRVLDDGDAHVQHAGIVALAAATLPGDARVIAALVRFAAHNEHWQCRKAAIEALEQLALPGCAVTVEALGALMRDKDSWVRDAHPLRLSKWLYKPFVSS